MPPTGRPVIYSAPMTKIYMSNLTSNLVNLSQSDLQHNLQGKLSDDQLKYLEAQRWLALLNFALIGLLLLGIILAILTHLYIVVIPLIFWLWILRNSWQYWRNLNSDRQTQDVSAWDGQIRYQMNFTPGLIRLAQYRIEAGQHHFSVNQDTLFQLQNLGTYRIFFTSNAEIFLGAMLIPSEQVEAIQPDTELLAQFTERELEILQLVADGLANKEIAQQLHLSVNTVKMYNSQIYQKLGVSRRTEAVAEAHKLGLVS